MEHQLSRISDDMTSATEGQDGKHPGHSESATTVSDKTDALSEQIQTLLEKLDRGGQYIEKEMSRTEQFLTDNFMRREDISADIEQISQEIHQLQENGFPE